MKTWVIWMGMAMLSISVLCSCSQQTSLQPGAAAKVQPLTVEDFMQPVAVPLNPLQKPLDRATGRYLELPPRPADDFVEEVIAELAGPATAQKPSADEEGGEEEEWDEETEDEEEEDYTQYLYVYRVKYQSASVLKAMLTEAYADAEQPLIFVSPDSSIAASETPPAATVNNDLVIRATRQEYAEIKALLAKIDRPPLQVYLDVLIAEVTMNDQESLGAILDLFLKGQIALGENLPVETFTSTFFTDVAAENQQGLAYSVASPGVFGAMIRSLAKVNRLKVLSEPHIFVHNNTEAKISVGQMVPVMISETDGTTTTQSVEQQEVATTLTVTPRIIHDGTVLLNISQIVNDVSSENYQGTGAPLLTTRDLTSSVVARDGMTVLMGGLILDKRYLDRKGIPLLQDLPLFGRAFRNDVMTQVKTELLVLVTPYIMWTPAHEAFYTSMMNQYVSPWKNNELYLERDSEKVKRLLRKLQGGNE